MFRPPEYAALINPMINAFATHIATSLPVRSFVLCKGVGRCAACAHELEHLGPKEWSPIGEYKLK